MLHTFITGHEKNQLTESAIYISLVYSLLPKDLTFPNLFMCPFHNLPIEKSVTKL